MIKKFILPALVATTLLSAKPDTVVFDFGGVMCQPPRKTPVVTFICDSLQMTKEEFITADKLRRFEIHNGVTDAEFWQDIARQRGITLARDWELQFKKVLKNAIRLNDDMYDLVEELKANNYRVAILSNITPNKAQLLREFGYYKPFETLILSCEVGMVKPDPRIYQLMLDRLGVLPESVLFVDDKEANVKAAEDLNIQAHHFKTTKQFKAYLIEKGMLTPLESRDPS